MSGESPEELADQDFRPSHVRFAGNSLSKSRDPRPKVKSWFPG